MTYKILLREIKTEINGERCLVCGLLVLPKLIYGFNAMPSKVLPDFSVEVSKKLSPKTHTKENAKDL